MIHSPTCEHAIRALIYLAEKDAPGPVLVREIADAADVPKQSLAKILHSLRRPGLVKSTKGPGGGYQLSRRGTDITVREVVEAVDGPLYLNGTCILGLDHCTDETPCALHDYWKGFREQYLGTIGNLSLKEAADMLARKRAGAANARKSA